MREAIELKDPTSLYHAHPLEENLFEWHFTIRGPPGTDFEGGMYHGRILLPPEYPMKPPSVVIQTPNGRFELNQKICLSASSYHPELWQASWGIRTMLLALIGFMPTSGLGTIGSLNCSSDIRRALAKKSREWVCPVCEVPNREILPELTEETNDGGVVKEMEVIVSQMAIKSPEEVDVEFKKISSSPNDDEAVMEFSGDVTFSSESPVINQHVQPVAPPSEEVVANVAPPIRTTPQTSRTTARQSSSDSSSDVTLLVIISIIVIIIAVLIARRLFLLQ
jgi:ubiquitin-conjugating enzyme E2 J1